MVINEKIFDNPSWISYILLLLQDGWEKGHLLIWDLAQVARKIGLVGFERRGRLRSNLLSRGRFQEYVRIRSTSDAIYGEITQLMP